MLQIVRNPPYRNDRIQATKKGAKTRKKRLKKGAFSKKTAVSMPLKKASRKRFIFTVFVCGPPHVARPFFPLVERLYFRIKEERLSGKDCEEMGFTDQTGGEITVFDMDGKELQMSFDNEFEGRRFEIELRNKEEVRLADIQMECRFFTLKNVNGGLRGGDRKRRSNILIALWPALWTPERGKK